MTTAARALVMVALVIEAAHAQPGPSTSEQLREGNAAALAGDWPRVAQLVAPLFRQPLVTADLGEAHRLAGLAAFFQQRREAAERHFLAYLHLEPTGRLDPALYPPEVVTFFNDIASRHAAELGAPASRSWWLTLIPPLGQLQNGERTKAYVLGGALGVLLAVNLTTYYYLNKWCQETDGPAGSGLSCYNGGDKNHAAARIRNTNIATGIGVLAVYAYGMIDAAWGYRRRSREPALQPFVAATPEDRVLGIIGRF